MDPIKDFLEIIKPARAQVCQNLVLFPLLAPESGEPDYLTLEEALEEEAVVITEVSEGGQVPELKLVNHSESKILIIDGEELKGAKQNRIVNATFLIGPKLEVVIPVSCDLLDATVDRCRAELPKVYSKELIELIFRQPY